MAFKEVEYEQDMGKNDVLYPLKKIEDDFVQRIQKVIGSENARVVVMAAPHSEDGDYGAQMAEIAKMTGELPHDFAKRVAIELSADGDTFIEGYQSKGPYLNLKLKMSPFGLYVVDQVLAMSDEYGKENIGKGEVVAIDMSSPNIAKRMNYPHMISTVLGDSIARILATTGHEVIKDNHIGDWGTQFGKLIVAIRRWGDEKKILESDDPVGALQDLYVKFHDEADKEKASKREQLESKIKEGDTSSVAGLQQMVNKITEDVMKRKKIDKDAVDHEKVLNDALDRLSDSQLENEAREWFLKLEQGDPEAKRLWKLCVDLSLKEFEKIYDFLGVKFDLVRGESFYENMLQDVVKEVKDKGVGEMSDGALVVDMEKEKLGVAVIVKADGASLYVTRDIATLINREEELKAGKVVYVVGGEQKLYFQQLFEILKRMGHPIGENCTHIYFGMVSLKEGKMSTRKGRVILLQDVINEGLVRADELLKEKNPELYKNEDIRSNTVRQVASGALKWNLLAQDPRRSIVFDWDEALKFEGNSSPYVQYQAVRAASLLNMAGVTKDELSKAQLDEEAEYFATEEERNLVKALAEFPDALDMAQSKYSPLVIANYTYRLARLFSTFYEKVSVLKAEDENQKIARLKLSAAVSTVLTNSLGLLGIEVPEKM